MSVPSPFHTCCFFFAIPTSTFDKALQKCNLECDLLLDCIAVVFLCIVLPMATQQKESLVRTGASRLLLWSAHMLTGEAEGRVRKRASVLQSFGRGRPRFTSPHNHEAVSTS